MSIFARCAVIPCACAFVSLPVAASAQDTTGGPAPPDLSRTLGFSGRFDAARHLQARWTARIRPGGDGYGLVFLHTRVHGESGGRPERWEEPNAPGCFGIGFDTRNPRTDNPFNEDGNIEGRPEREVSLHWNGVEVMNRLSPVEFREGTHRYDVAVDFVTGGAEVTVRIDRHPVYDRAFVPFMTPYPARALLGGYNDAGAVGVTGFHASATSPAGPSEEPVRVRAFDAALNNKEHHTLTSTADFPKETDGVGRVLCTLTLGPTPQGVDPWDRMAAVYVYDEAGRKFEILRYMTPYNRGYSWTADVTDYLPLLRGRRKMEVWCETWGAGWLVSVDFRFYRGRLDRIPYRVDNVWLDTVLIGNPAKPVEKILKPKVLKPDREARAARLRFIVTGHGMSPNTDNAAEFYPLSRTVSVNGARHENLLWKTDNYLNPCRPQGGTWKYDRAGWGPGALVEPWDVDITKEIRAGKPVEVRYTVAPYVNRAPVEGNPARHWITAQVIYYR